jgi:hypothetical protein
MYFKNIWIEDEEVDKSSDREEFTNILIEVITKCKLNLHE